MEFKAIKNIFNTKAYLNLSILVVSFLVITTFILQFNIIPSLKKIAFDNILNEAKKVSYYMSNLVDYNNEEVEDIDKKLKKLINDFKIDKIHYFNKNGKVIYSTSKEKIGYINSYSYFKEIISKGKSYYSIKLKNSKSFEKEPINKDVIEIYIPIMENGDFAGAFELYYDISNNVQKFDGYSNLILKVNILMVFIIFGLFSYLIHLISVKSINEKDLRSKDYLTNLYNRRYFYEIVENYILLAKREKKPFSICMIDIDHFKKINDTYGHDIGDKILKEFAIETKKIIRESDILVRFGGEEFLLLLPNTNIKNAEIIANKICGHFQSLQNDIVFTVSIGIAEHKQRNKIDDTIIQADKCLYKAKNDGRNRVCYS